MIEGILDSLKAALLDTTLPQPEIGEIEHLTSLLNRLERIEGAELVAEYSWWRETYPHTTAEMIRVARARERSDRRALQAYLRAIGPGSHTA
jgi:hypothetical protein